MHPCCWLLRCSALQSTPCGVHSRLERRWNLKYRAYAFPCPRSVSRAAPHFSLCLAHFSACAPSLPSAAAHHFQLLLSALPFVGGPCGALRLPYELARLVCAALIFRFCGFLRCRFGRIRFVFLLRPLWLMRLWLMKKPGAGGCWGNWGDGNGRGDRGTGKGRSGRLGRSGQWGIKGG